MGTDITDDLPGVLTITTAFTSSVPEPSPLALMLLGLALIGFGSLRRRRRVLS